jgi:hypothetical protein
LEFSQRRTRRTFWLSEIGRLLALTEVGEFTIKLLRFNRQPLTTKRRQDYRKLEERQILEQTKRAVDALIRLSQQQRDLLEEQQKLLEEQRRLIELLFKE